MTNLLPEDSSRQKAVIDFLMLNSAVNGIPQIPRHIFTLRFPLACQRYPELELFRQQIEQNHGFIHQPYTNNKGCVLFYQGVFISFAVLFLILGSIVILTPSSLSYVFFGKYHFFKEMVAFICVLLSLMAFMIGYGIRTERETIFHYARKAKREVAKIYARKRVKMGLKRFFAFFGNHQRQAVELRQLYHEAYDKINDLKEDALQLVQRIAMTHGLDANMRETLYNQAIAELNDKLILHTHTFKQAKSSYCTNY